MKSVAIIFGYGLGIVATFLVAPFEWWLGILLAWFSLGVYALFRTAQGY